MEQFTLILLRRQNISEHIILEPNTLEWRQGWAKEFLPHTRPNGVPGDVTDFFEKNSEFSVGSVAKPKIAATPSNHYRQTRRKK